MSQRDREKKTNEPMWCFDTICIVKSVL